MQNVGFSTFKLYTGNDCTVRIIRLVRYKSRTQNNNNNTMRRMILTTFQAPRGRNDDFLGGSGIAHVHDESLLRFLGGYRHAIFFFSIFSFHLSSFKYFSTRWGLSEKGKRPVYLYVYFHFFFFFFVSSDIVVRTRIV